MHSPRSFGCGILAFLLIGPLGCNYAIGTPQQCKVIIDNCTVKVDLTTCKNPTDPKTPLVNIGDSIEWTPPSNHSIRFPSWHAPFRTNTPSIGTAYTVTGDSLCSAFGYCYYPYDLFQGTSTVPCKDPGVRVVPPGGAVYYLLGLAVLLVVAFYTIFNIKTRKRASA
jgi:hypothetical protein